MRKLAGATALLLLRRRELAVRGALRIGASPTVAVEHAISSAVLHGRTVARSFGLTRLREAVGSDVAFLNDPSAVSADLFRARQLGARQALATAQRAEASEAATVEARWAEALRATRARAETTAISETHAAANEAREYGGERAAGTLITFELLKVWDATEDLRTCPECSALDGTIVGADEPFPGGATPGAVHARCRCWLTIMRSARDDEAISIAPR